MRNIIDLREEHEGVTVKALTITHENLEWSFSFTQNCLDAQHGGHGPHYRFQMRIDGRPFHDFGNRHILLSEFEIWLLAVELGKHPKIKRLEVQGMGMQDALDQINPEILLDSMQNRPIELLEVELTMMVMLNEYWTRCEMP